MDDQQAAAQALGSYQPIAQDNPRAEQLRRALAQQPGAHSARVVELERQLADAEKVIEAARIVVNEPNGQPTPAEEALANAVASYDYPRRDQEARHD